MSPDRPSQKNSFISCEWLLNYFLPPHFVNPIQDYYLCKPITGLSITSVNFFQDGSCKYQQWLGLTFINSAFSC